jgi:hypothetical protein
MPFALAAAMLTAIGLSLAGLGLVGATLAAWQLAGWLLGGGLPPVAGVWRHSGLTGELFVAFFAWLPELLAGAVLFHAFVAWLGLGLLWRRPWARRGGLWFACAWAATAALSWLVVRAALGDLARGYPDRAGFAAMAGILAGQVALLNVALGAALAWLLLQPAVRAQFRSGT